MTNRREFLQIGVTASAWPLVARAAHAAGLDEPAPLVPIAIAVYDTRFAQSVGFAGRCLELGVPTRAIEADMTRLWYEEIHYRWQEGPAAIAGLTAYGPMFCFAELARDVGMRVVFRTEHRLGGAAPAHHVSGPLSMLGNAVSACRTDRLGAGLADVVVSCPRGRSEIGFAAVGTVDPRPDEDALYTWVIAPASRVRG